MQHKQKMSVNKDNLHESKQDMIETFFLKNIRYFTKAWTFYMLILKTGWGGEASYIFIIKIFTNTPTGVFISVIMIILL